MSHYSFEFPYIFLLLILFWFCSKKCPAKNIAIYLPYIHLLISKKSIKSRWIEIFKWLSIVALVTALASPIKIDKIYSTKQEGRDIMLIIDSSKSMNEKNFDENNLSKDKFTAVKEVVTNFINNRKSDRIGIINFSSSAFIASPLTFDKEFLKYILNKQRVGIVGSRTAIYDALLQGLYILSNSQTKSKIALLLTDGADNMSQTKYSEILDLTKRSKIKLYIIGVGTFDDLDVPKLKELAKKSNGKFFLATNSQTLKVIYKEIEKSETTKIKDKSYKKYTYYFYFPLIFSIIFLLIFVYYKSAKGITK